MKTCRICLNTDLMIEMYSCFEHPDIILDLYFLSNVAIVETNGDEAKICRRCAKNIKKAADFKRLCIQSDTNRKKTSDERFIWFEKLQMLKDSMNSHESKHVEQPKPSECTNECQENQAKSTQLNDIISEANSLIAEIESYEEKIAEPQSLKLQNSQLVDFIEYLNYEQLKELSNDVAQILDNNVFKETKC